MSSKNSSNSNFERHRSFGRDVADTAIQKGVMFGGLRPVAFDPELDPQPGVCFNCRNRGHRRIECPHPQVSAVCHNCGRRDVTLHDCPRCSARHHQHLARIREDERKLVRATREMRINDNCSIGKSDAFFREYMQCEDESSAKLSIVSVDMPSGTDSAGRGSRREYRASRPPFAKRTRADSGSRKYYFHLGRETPEHHENYSSRETVCAAEACESREKNTVEWTTDGAAHGETKPEQKCGDDDTSTETDGEYESCTDENNNTNSTTWSDGKAGKKQDSRSDGKADKKQDPRGDGRAGKKQDSRSDGRADDKQSPRSDGSNWRADTELQSGCVLTCNLSARADCSANGALSQRSAEIEVQDDVKNFLELMRKMSGLPVTTQELVIRHVVAERERLLGGDQESSVASDPIQEFSELVVAVAHLPVSTQNDVLSGVAAERELMTRLDAA